MGNQIQSSPQLDNHKKNFFERERDQDFKKYSCLIDGGCITKVCRRV